MKTRRVVLLLGVLGLLTDICHDGLCFARSGFSTRHPGPTMGAGGSATPVIHLRVLAYCMNFQVTILLGDAVDVHRTIAALSSNIFVQWIPCYTLYEMIMFRNFMDAFSCVISVVYLGYVTHYD